MIFLAVAVALLVLHALWSADRAEKRVNAQLTAEREARRDETRAALTERRLWNDERLSLLARLDALHTPPMGYGQLAPAPPLPAHGNETEERELSLTEAARLSLIQENL